MAIDFDGWRGASPRNARSDILLACHRERSVAISMRLLRRSAARNDGRGRPVTGPISQDCLIITEFGMLPTHEHGRVETRFTQPVSCDRIIQGLQQVKIENEFPSNTRLIPKSLDYFYDDAHFTIKGADQRGRGLASFILENNLIPIHSSTDK